MVQRFVIAGSDPRCRYLGESLLDDGFDAVFLDKETAQRTNLDSIDCETLKSASAVVLFSPAASSKDVCKVLRNLREGSIVFAGRPDDCALALSAERRVNYINLQDDERFAERNALPTAEGALALVIENTPATVAGLRLHVLGGGKCARAIADLFARCGARPTLVARKQADREWASSKGFRALSFDELKKDPMDVSVVINTVPVRVLGEEVLERLPIGALWLEIASKPYGIDEQLALELGCRFLLASGLPGRFSPQSAATILKTTVLEILAQER